MNFLRIFLIVAIVLAAFAVESEAGWLKKIGKKVERAGQRTRDATVKGLVIAQQAANVVATAKQG